MNDNGTGRIRRLERWRIGWFAAAAVCEAALLIVFLVLTDFANRDHVLLLVAALFVYGPLAFCMLWLYTHIQLCTERILRALEPGREQRDGML